MKTKLYIIGAGGHGKVVADAALLMDQWQAIYFLDDHKIGEELLGLEVIAGSCDYADFNPDESEFIVAIGDNMTREKIQSEIKKAGYRLATVIHPSAIIGRDVSIGEGSVVFAQVVINPSTTIGDGCILNTACSVDHDNNIGNFVHLSPGVRSAGTVTVGERTWLGINATIINNCSIARDVIIGASTVCIDSIIESGTYVGNPAKMLSY
ncbi:MULTISPECIES: acetyltransferase [Aerococcus]|uniref:Acetyltransferase n=1 Tax=Aerococcus sanguinicola TaxID=119206 RepID=A0A5N1GPN4_9LACT|nr:MULTISPECIES: acetyltransferase [Aerococcus]KAA9302219.1 acetyltransferase [Aerococcus sanguinicola]MDK6368352.1 acetyltransferase [Aerococcus sp. UMB9870]MDK6679434.1 acetyltransferase [Aerococcus sp. UMB8608]MDK6687199.1 acetyltransferase [Aerococcus sp. UMB8623]MDK6941102.1 acetyltransferase [Aerococcus sp. UMB8487]